MRQQGGIRPKLYRNNVLRVMGDSRLLLFRMEYHQDLNCRPDEVTGTVQFWYVGSPHDLSHPGGSVPTDFTEYAANFLQQEYEEEPEEASSPFFTRSRARAAQEMRAHLEMEEVADEFVPGDDDEGSLEEMKVRKRMRTRGVAGEEDVIVSKKVKCCCLFETVVLILHRLLHQLVDS